MLLPAIEEAPAMDTVTIIQVPVQQGGFGWPVCFRD